MRNAVFSRKNLLTIFLAVVLFAIEWLLRYGIVTNDTAMFELTIVRIIIASILGYMLIIVPQKKWDHYRFLKIATTTSMFVLVFGLIVLAFVNPTAVLDLSKEDGVVENLSAAFLFIASGISFMVGVRFYKKKTMKPTIIFLAVCALFFVMGMEEISWMQRIIGVETSGLFLKYNMQSEMNIHNLHTRLFNDAFYFVAFLLFVVGTYYGDEIRKLLKKLRLHDFAILLPSPWLLLPFSLMMGLTSPYVTVGIVRISTYIFTFWILLSGVVKPRKNINANKYLSVLAIFLIIISVLVSNFSAVALGDHNSLQEYREFMIATGLMVYILDIYINLCCCRQKTKIAQEHFNYKEVGNGITKVL